MQDRLLKRENRIVRGENKIVGYKMVVREIPRGRLYKMQIGREDRHLRFIRRSHHVQRRLAKEEKEGGGGGGRKKEDAR